MENTENVNATAVDAKGPSKKSLNKAAKEAKKAEQKAARESKKEDVSKSTQKEEKTEVFTTFGTLPLNQSQTRLARVFTNVKDLDASKVDQTVLVRARIHSVRGTGGLCFLVLRQRLYSVQVVIAKGPEVPKQMVSFAAGLSKESIVDITGKVTAVTEKIASTSQQFVEIAASSIFLVSAAETPLPIGIDDAARPKSVIKAQEKIIAAIEYEITEVTNKLKDASAEEKTKLEAQLAELIKKRDSTPKYVKVNRDTRLNNRVVELRTPTNQAILRIQSGVGQLFRDYLVANEFTEIHSPKLVGAASEGGAEVFQVKYFENWAYLAQSPQFYKQMAITADMERVFEIGPVFRAERSFTHRHLCEFVGLDLEMTFNEHYHEVLDLLDALFFSMFEGLKTKYAKELEIINQQFPFEPLKYKFPSLRLKFPEAVSMLREAGAVIGDFEDLSTPTEKLLGKLVREKYDTDFFILDGFPTDARPFYTMTNPEDPRYSNSYDFFIRGEEIMSGAQRVHESKVLEERARTSKKKVALESIMDYVNSFKYGTMPHAGGGIGLERVTMLYLGLKNIRQTSLFPRDPNRITP